MATVLPTLTVKISNNDITKPLTYSEENFTVSPYAETAIPIKSTDGFVQIPKSYIDTIKKIIVIAPVDPGPPIAVTTTLKLTIDNLVDPVYDINLPLNNFFMFQPSPSFAETITAVSISTTSLTDIVPQVRIYGV